MTAVLKRLDPTRVELEIPISPEEFEAARNRVFHKVVKNVRIPGFRPGKAPRKLYEQQYGTQRLNEEAIDEMVPRAYSQAIADHALSPVDRPKIEFMPAVGAESLRLKAAVTVRPKIVLADYEKLRLDVNVPAPEADDVDKTIARLLRESATLVPVERAAQLGDVVVMDFAGSIDGEPFEGGTAQSQQLELNEDNFIPGFAGGIAGLSPGESKEVSAKFPDEYHAKELAGKEVIFSVTVHEVKEPELPELDDEFAARYLPQTPTVDALRAEVERRINSESKRQMKDEHAEAYLGKLLELHDFALPEPLIERELQGEIDQKRAEIVRANGNWETHLSNEGKTEESLRVELRPDAEKRVKTILLIEEIARREKIEATNAEIDAEIGELAYRYGQPKERVKEAIGGQLHGLVDGIIRSKTLDRLLDMALSGPSDGAPERVSSYDASENATVVEATPEPKAAKASKASSSKRAAKASPENVADTVGDAGAQSEETSIGIANSADDSVESST